MNIPEHILSSDLYIQLREDYGDDMSFLSNMVIINFDEIENNKQYIFFVNEYTNCDIVRNKIHDDTKHDEQLEILKDVHSDGIPWEKWISEKVVLYGNLKCLKYLHENGCTWNENTSSKAADYGYIECLKYAHENVCP